MGGIFHPIGVVGMGKIHVLFSVEHNVSLGDIASHTADVSCSCYWIKTLRVHHLQDMVVILKTTAQLPLNPMDTQASLGGHK